MNDGLIEQLLHEGESASLDYKRDQYPFAGAVDEVKSELLKDILAFANGWRHADAFILIGIQEVACGRSVVMGVTQHIPENDLQQFVNSKTNRPVVFSYRAYPFEGKELGIVIIPQQDRPIYLRNTFGKLRKNEVYYRQGTTTAIATPEDVIKMGLSEIEKRQVEIVADRPRLSVKFAGGANSKSFELLRPDPIDDVVLEQKLQARRNAVPQVAHIATRSHFARGEISNEEYQRYLREREQYFQNYYEYQQKLAEHLNVLKRRISFSIEIANEGTAPADDVDVTFKFPDGFEMDTSSHFPSAPIEPKPPATPMSDLAKMMAGIGHNLAPLRLNPTFPPTFTLKKTNSYEFTDHFRRIKHGSSVVLKELFLLFDSYESAKPFDCDYVLRVANIPEAVEGQLHFAIRHSAE